MFGQLRRLVNDGGPLPRGKPLPKAAKPSARKIPPAVARPASCARTFPSRGPTAARNGLRDDAGRLHLIPGPAPARKDPQGRRPCRLCAAGLRAGNKGRGPPFVPPAGALRPAASSAPGCGQQERAAASGPCRADDARQQVRTAEPAGKPPTTQGPATPPGEGPARARTSSRPSGARKRQEAVPAERPPGKSARSASRGRGITFRYASPRTSCRPGCRSRPHADSPCAPRGSGSPRSHRGIPPALPRPAARGRSPPRDNGTGTG